MVSDHWFCPAALRSVGGFFGRLAVETLIFLFRKFTTERRILLALCKATSTPFSFLLDLCCGIEPILSFLGRVFVVSGRHICCFDFLSLRLFFGGNLNQSVRPTTSRVARVDNSLTDNETSGRSC